MANLSTTIEIIFGAVDRDTRSTINSINDSLGTMGSAVDKVSAPFADLTHKLLATEAAVVSLAVAYAAYGVNEAVKFQTAQTDLNKVLSDSDPKIGEFTKTVTDLSDKYGIASASILQGIANFKQAGFTAKEAADLQKNALDLMIAGDIEAGQSSEYLVAMIKGFGSEASSAARYVEALNNVSNDYATDVKQLAMGMADLSPILKTMGFSFEEGTALLTPVIEVFGSGSEAANALKTGLLKLLDDSKPVMTALADLGVSQTDLNGRMRSGKDIFYDVAKAFESLDQNQKLVFASQLFGLEQAPKLVKVFDDLAKVNKITASALANTGSVSKEVELRLASAEGQINRFKTAFDNLARVVGGEILTQFTGIVGGATEIEIAFRKVVESGGLAPLFAGLRAELGDFETLLRTIAKNLPDAFNGVDFSRLLESLGGLGDEVKDAFGKIFGNIDLTTVEGLRSAIQTAINIITSLVNVTTGIVDQFSPIFAAIGEAGRQVSGASDESSVAAGKLLGVMTILHDFGAGLGLVIVMLKNSEADITNVFNVIVGGGRLFTNALQLAFDFMALAIVGALEDINFSIGNFLKSIGFSETAQKFLNDGEEFKLTANGIKANMASNAHDMADAWTQMTTLVSVGAKSSSESIKSVGASASSADDSLAKLFMQAGDGANSFIKLYKAVEDFSKSTGPVQSGADLMNSQLAKLGLTFDYLTGQFLNIPGVSGKVIDAFGDIVNASGRTDAEIDAQIEKMYRWTGALDNVAEGIHGNNAVYDAHGKYLHEFGEESAKASDATNKLGESIKDTAKSNTKGTEEWKRVQDVLATTQKQMNDFNVEMAKLADHKYEIDVKANVDLQTAQIEADTQRIAAAFTAASDVISSLTSGVTDLWELFAQTNSWDGARSEIRDAALRQEENLRRELDLQERQVNAVIEQAHATTARLSSGAPLISIDGGNLAPELELVFDKILKFTQIKASQQGLSMLVGL